MSDSGQIVAICERARGRLDELVEEIGAAVRAEVPSYRPGGELDDADVRATLARYLTLILDEVEGRAVSGAELDPVMRRRAGEGISLEDMLHSYRVGISRLWEVLAREAADDAAATQGLVAATPRLFALLDRISLRASEIQHEIALRDARRREQVRASLLDSVLTTDTSLGPAFWDAVALLGIPREGRFRIVEVDRAGDDDGASGGLDLEPALLAGGAERCWFRLGPSSQTGLVALRP
ncbi:MAG TPA: hypothetical protein VJ204_01080, partial [Solirubrobacterales bacterium]|nr:hypothetical protein [Solirubrobacterales bacterium]